MEAYYTWSCRTNKYNFRSVADFLIDLSDWSDQSHFEQQNLEASAFEKSASVLIIDFVYSTALNIRAKTNNII